jgi:hypothetical protein
MTNEDSTLDGMAGKLVQQVAKPKLQQDIHFSLFKTKPANNRLFDAK